MIRFYHGYGSSSETNKFTEIDYEDKHAVTVNYDKLSYNDVETLYSTQIEKEKPELLVGHSLGGYWALKMSAKYEIPTVIINPALFPKNSLPHLNYSEDIIEDDLDNKIPKYVYIELADEKIPVLRTIDTLRKYSKVTAIAGGHHRVQFMDKVNDVITFAMNTYMVD